MTPEQTLWCAVIAAGLVGLGAGRVLLRHARRAVRRLRRRATRAALATLTYVVLCRWLPHAPRRRPRVLRGDDIYRSCALSTWTGDPARCRWCDKPLPEDRTRFCGPRCSDEAQRNHDFDEARSAARQRDGYQCVRCGSTEDLEVHHAAERAMGRHAVAGCWHHLDGLLTLCRRCHAVETARQRSWGWAS